MDPLFWKSFLQGIVQGLTEFLPVSSTGHMILFDQFLAMGKPFSDMFEVVVQLGSILAVVVYFAKKIFPASLKKADLKPWFFFWLKIAAAMVPAVIVGGLLSGITILTSSFIGLLIKTLGIDAVIAVIRRKKEI